MRGWLSLWLLGTGCAKTPDTSDSSGASPDSTAPTDSGTDTPITDSTPTVATVAVHSPSVARYAGATLVASDPAGAFIGAVAVTEDAMVLVGVPNGGSLTWAYVDPVGDVYLDTVSGVRDGDELWLTDPLGTMLVSVGTYTVDIPAAPPVPFDLWRAGVPYVGAQGYSLPYSFGGSVLALPGSPDTWSGAAMAYVGDDPVPVAVAYDTDQPLVGAPPDQTVSLVYDPWVTDFGRQTVIFDYAGPAASVALWVGGRWDGWSVGAEQWVYASGTEGHLEATAFADADAHDEVAIRLNQAVADDVARRESMIVLSDRDVPQRGSADTLTLSAADLPPLADQLAPPLASRTAGLTLPEGWSCDGRAANLVEVGWYATDGANYVNWTSIAPYAESWTRPTLSPELESALAKHTAFSSYASVKSIPEGYDAYRTSPLLAQEVTESKWLAASPTGGRVCVATCEVSD